MSKSSESPRITPLVVGWREWVGLPQLGITRVKAKIDTGARSSSLHAIDMKMETRDGRQWVRFKVHPLQRNAKKTVDCEAEVVELRKVRSSSGHSQQRPVIVTEIELHGQKWAIELTLANRTEMGFRMLLGREAIRGRYLVDPGQSYFDRLHAPPRKRRSNVKTVVSVAERTGNRAVSPDPATPTPAPAPSSVTPNTRTPNTKMPNTKASEKSPSNTHPGETESP